MRNIFIEKLYEYSKHEKKVAVRYEKQSISYQRLDILSSLVAEHIKNNYDVRDNKSIIIYQTRGIEFIIYIFAIMKCNCAYIPIENNNPPTRVKTIYEDVNASLILSDENIIDGCNCLSPKKELIVDELLYMKDRQKKAEHIGVECDEEDLVYIIYTSGTTGKPKGVKIMYKNVVNLVESLGEIVYEKINEYINVGVVASFSFDASIKQIFASFYYGNTLVIANEKVRHFGRLLHKFHNNNSLTVCDGTPSHFKLMLQQYITECSNIKYLLLGGENLHWDLLHQYKKKFEILPHIINVYGPTECCVDVSYYDIDNDNLEKGIVPIGKPLKNTKLKIIDENENEIRNKFTKGELVVYGRQVGAGYVGDIGNKFQEDETGENRLCYKTGDLVEYNENMDIVVISRIDKQIKISGFRIELGEIIANIEDYTKKQAVVMKHDDYLVAFICGDFDENDVRTYLEERLPKYMIPKTFVKIESISLTTNGKVDEKGLAGYLERIMRSDGRK